MEGATHLYIIPRHERRPTDGRYIRLPLSTDGPFYPLSTLRLPPFPPQPTNAYFTAPYASPDELRELDIIHLSSTILSTILYISSTLLYSNDMEDWSVFKIIWFTAVVMVVNSFIYRWGYFYFSLWVGRFEWHLERPLWGVGGVEHFGLMGFWRLWVGVKGLFLDYYWKERGRRRRRRRGDGYGYGYGVLEGCEEGCEECEADLWDEGLGDGFRREDEDTESEGDVDEGVGLLGSRGVRRRRSVVSIGFEGV
ncbi:hypothetical protein TWF506_008052 [Arthrobotrys conoides]|uniref:Uncharacterized protein n=1 Tax=Arthrobotrys conoides TaxID=74498 RepID=A0AAN8PF16_9PEZI